MNRQNAYETEDNQRTKRQVTKDRGQTEKGKIDRGHQTEQKYTNNK